MGDEKSPIFFPDSHKLNLMKQLLLNSSGEQSLIFKRTLDSDSMGVHLLERLTTMSPFTWYRLWIASARSVSTSSCLRTRELIACSIELKFWLELSR